MKSELVSIIIPVYNAEKYLYKCLKSVFAQSYKNIEVICINDGSIDQSLKILRQFENDYPDIMKICTIKNGGQANARNVGIDMAMGDFLCFIDSDDYVNEFLVEKLIKNMKENNSDLSICDMERIFEGEASLLERTFKYDIELHFQNSVTIYDHPEIICYLMNAPFAKLIRKNFLDKNKIRFIKGYIYEDLVFVQEILSNSPVVSMIDEKLYYYIVRNNSTMTSKKSKVTDMFIAYKNVYDAYSRNGIDQQFKTELDYLCLYHVMIGTSYRMWRSGQYGLIKSIRICKKYVKQYGCSKNNSYIKAKGILSKLYVKFLLD